MNIAKPLVACALLGLVSLTGCGSDTEQGSNPQPPPPPPPLAEPGPGRGSAALPDAGTPSGAYAICRNLRSGDPGFPNWVYCCDNDTMTQSFWTGVNGSRTGSWDGSCYTWGVR